MKNFSALWMDMNDEDPLEFFNPNDEVGEKFMPFGVQIRGAVIHVAHVPSVGRVGPDRAYLTLIQESQLQHHDIGIYHFEISYFVNKVERLSTILPCPL